MRLKGLLDGVDERLLLEVARTAGRSRVRVVDLLEDRRGEDEQHHLQRPDGVAVLVLCLRKVVQEVEKVLATLVKKPLFMS